MSSSGNERSISGSMSLPQWMKTKIGDRYDLDQGFPSPTEDESFFLIRYPKSMQQPDLGNLCSTSKPKMEVRKQEPLPCQRFLAEIQAVGLHFIEGATMKRSTAIPGSALQSAAALAEQNFKNDAADCGKSVISLAQDMISNGMFGYNAASSMERSNTVEKSVTEKQRNENNLAAYHARQRRNSKSLPASPLSSPKISPKLHRKNPYFSDPFTKSTENFSRSGWLLSNLLTLRKSVEDLTSGTESASESESPGIQRKKASKNFLNPDPKPSEIREMNFWSPQSM